MGDWNRGLLAVLGCDGGVMLDGNVVVLDGNAVVKTGSVGEKIGMGTEAVLVCLRISMGATMGAVLCTIASCSIFSVRSFCA